MHAEISGTVDFYEKDDPSCLKRLRSLVALLPEAEAATNNGEERKCAAPAKDPDAVYDLISLDGQKPYDVRDLLASIIDADSLDEYKADTARRSSPPTRGSAAAPSASSPTSATRCARKRTASRSAA